MAQQDAGQEDPDPMKTKGKNLWWRFPEAKGEKPYDQAAVDAAMAELETPPRRTRHCFPTSIKGQTWRRRFLPSPKIWEDKAGFDAKSAGFVKAVADAKAKIKDAAA